MADDTMMMKAEAAARALLDQRIELIRELTAAASELEPLQRAAAEGEQRVLHAWAEALAGGWTADELKGLGLPEPDRKAMAKKTPPKPRAATVAAGTASSAATPVSKTEVGTTKPPETAPSAPGPDGTAEADSTAPAESEA